MNDKTKLLADQWCNVVLELLKQEVSNDRIKQIADFHTQGLKKRIENQFEQMDGLADDSQDTSD